MRERGQLLVMCELIIPHAKIRSTPFPVHSYYGIMGMERLIFIFLTQCELVGCAHLDVLCSRLTVTAMTARLPAVRRFRWKNSHENLINFIILAGI